MYRRIARYIAEAAVGRKGNYMAFFPSYRMMEDIYDIFLEQADGIESVMQMQSMSETQREEFLEQFEYEREKSFVGFLRYGRCLFRGD